MLKTAVFWLMASSWPAARGGPLGPKFPAKIPISPMNEPPSSPPPLRDGKMPFKGKKTVIANDAWLLSMATPGPLACGDGVTGAALLGGGVVADELSKLAKAAPLENAQSVSS